MLRIAEIVHDVRMREIEPSRRRVVAVALLGDRERHDSRFRRDETRAHLLALCEEKTHFAYATDDAPSRSRRALLDSGIEAILRRQPVADVRRAQAHAAEAPRTGLQRQRVVRVHGGLGAMERADAEMDDPDAYASWIVRRLFDRRGQISERSQRQAFHIAG